MGKAGTGPCRHRTILGVVEAVAAQESLGIAPNEQTRKTLMQMTLSLFSLAAGALYLVVGGQCLWAGFATRRLGRPGREAAWWSGLAVLFVALFAWRVTGIEENLRTVLRGMLQADGDYGTRQELQGPLSAAVVLAASLMIFLGWRVYSRTRKGSLTRLVAVARLAMIGLVGLVALRLISLHVADKLLYGPAHLNWLIDIGCTLVIGICAFRYARVPTRRR